MDKIIDWIDSYRSTDEAKERKELVENVSPELAAEEDVASILSWWKVRYFYANKAKNRLGDRFVGILLFANNPDNSKMGYKELEKLYQQTFNTPDSEYAFSNHPDGLIDEFIDAANLYVETMKDPQPMLGLIPRKDKTAEDKRYRVAKIIVRSHLVPIWRTIDSLPHMNIVAKSMCFSANRKIPGILPVIVSVVEDEDIAGFANWFSELDVLSDI